MKLIVRKVKWIGSIAESQDTHKYTMQVRHIRSPANVWRNGKQVTEYHSGITVISLLSDKSKLPRICYSKCSEEDEFNSSKGILVAVQQFINEVFGNWILETSYTTHDGNTLVVFIAECTESYKSNLMFRELLDQGYYNNHAKLTDLAEILGESSLAGLPL